MRIRVSIPSADEARLRGKILEGVEKVEREGPDGDEWSTVRVPDVSRCEMNHADLFVFNTTPRHTHHCVQTLLIDPSHFRTITDLLNKECKGKGRIETIAFAATATTGN